jgi:hypothetical protein
MAGQSRQALQKRETTSSSCATSRVCFVMPLDPIDPSDVTLVPGSPTHLVLAWSHESDFDHHSADRDAVNVLL